MSSKRYLESSLRDWAQRMGQVGIVVVVFGAGRAVEGGHDPLRGNHSTPQSFLCMLGQRVVHAGSLAKVFQGSFLLSESRSSSSSSVVLCRGCTDQSPKVGVEGIARQGMRRRRTKEHWLAANRGLPPITFLHENGHPEVAVCTATAWANQESFLLTIP